MSAYSGWLAVALIVFAATVPLVYRAREKKRAAPGSRAIGGHVALGAAAAVFAFVHVLLALPALGSSQAIAGGATALLPAGGAFFVLVAHAGVGLQLRDPKLRDRPKKRRVHQATAITIVVLVLVHVVVLRVAR